VLFGILSLVRLRPVAAGTLMGLFCLYYGIARGLSDFLRVNDNTVLGLTGAQFLCIALIPTGIWILARVTRATAALEAAAAAALDGDAEAAVTADDAGDADGDDTVDATGATEAESAPAAAGDDG
jgi:hypothetical protein